MTKRQEFIAALVLIVLQGAQLIYGLETDGMAFDELLYIASGYRQSVTGDHRFGAEHPPLARLASAVPLLPLGPKVRDLDSREVLAGWGWAYQFVFVDNAGMPLLHRARSAIVLMSLLVSLVVWRWARDAGGPTSGLAALALVSFHPSLLAHGHLVTTDMASALTMVVTSWRMWRWCADPAPRNSFWVGLALGVSFATRLTALLLIPALLLVAAFWWRQNATRPHRFQEVSRLGVACFLLVPLVIWASYGFRYEAWPGEAMPQIVPAPWLTAIEGTPLSHVLSLLRKWHALPAAYLASIEVYLIKSTIGHQAYLLGQISASGWSYYYVVALIVKNTPGFLVALAVTLGLLRRQSSASVTNWLVPALLLFAAASSSRVQVGERYILPVYVYLSLAMASLAPGLLRERGGVLILTIVASLHAIPSVLAAREGHLSYFNSLVGRDEAHLVLGDSNLDWGQDLPRLARWLEAHPGTRLQLAYWGTDDPGQYGIQREDLPGHTLYPTRPPARPFSGTIAISPTLLVGLYPPPGMAGVYREFLKRRPDDRAGVFLIYNLP